MRLAPLPLHDCRAWVACLSTSITVDNALTDIPFHLHSPCDGNCQSFYSYTLGGLPSLALIECSTRRNPDRVRGPAYTRVLHAGWRARRLDKGRVPVKMVHVADASIEHPVGEDEH